MTCWNSPWNTPSSEAHRNKSKSRFIKNTLHSGIFIARKIWRPQICSWPLNFHYFKRSGEIWSRRHDFVFVTTLERRKFQGSDTNFKRKLLPESYEGFSDEIFWNASSLPSIKSSGVSCQFDRVEPCSKVPLDSQWPLIHFPVIFLISYFPSWCKTFHVPEENHPFSFLRCDSNFLVFTTIQ